MKDNKPISLENLSPADRAEYGAALGLFTRQRHRFRGSFRSAGGLEFPLAERQGTAAEFRQFVAGILQSRPVEIVLEIMTFQNGKGGKPGFEAFRLRPGEYGLVAAEKPAAAPPAAQPPLSHELKVLELEHRFSTMFADQKNRQEQEDLRRRIAELERTLKERDDYIGYVEGELEEAREEAGLALRKLGNMAKVGAQGLGGLITGVVRHFRPALADSVDSHIDGLLGMAGITGPQDPHALSADGGGYGGNEGVEDQGQEYVFSYATEKYLSGADDEEFRKADALLASVSRSGGRASRVSLLETLLKNAEELARPDSRSQKPDFNQP